MEKLLSCKKTVKVRFLKTSYDTMPQHAVFPAWYYETIIQVNKHWVYYTHCMCLKPEIAEEKNDNQSKRSEIISKSSDEVKSMSIDSKLFLS